MASALGSGGALATACLAWRAIGRVGLGDFAGAQADLDAIGVGVVPNPFPGGFQLLAIALLSLARDGDIAAEQVVIEGMPLVRPDAMLGFVPTAYVSVAAHVFERRGRTEDSVRCHALALQLAEAAGASWDCGLMRGIPKPDVDALATELGRARFDELFAEGAAMPLTEMTAYLQRGRGPRKRPTTGWNSLTPTEQQVVDLVVEGATNPEIAEKLFMAVPTVKSHLTHVYAKLGVSNRTQLTAEAGRR
jgi:DNA-binding CsgD family transcriptional regulator